MSAISIQSNFSHGELDPRMLTSVDLQLYYQCASKVRNLYVRPQGGVKSRHGTVYQSTIGTGQSLIYKLAYFVYDEENHYLLVFKDATLDIYKEITGEVGVSLSLIVEGLSSPYLDADIDSIQFAQNGNFMVIVTPNHPPQELIRDKTDELTWTYQPMVFKNNASYDFNHDYFNDTFKLDETDIGKGRTLTVTGGTPFTANHVGGLFISIGKNVGEPVGVAIITAVATPPSASATVNIVAPFEGSLKSSESGADGSQCFLAEKAFSAERGYPISVAFYEGRLVFGGSPSLPQQLFLSRVGDFSNFGHGQALDDDAIASPLAGNNYTKILYVVSDKSLQIFTTDGEFSSQQTFDEPLTPGSSSFRKQSSYGSDTVKPVIHDDMTFYVKKGGNSVMSYVYAQSSSSYGSINASIFASHLISNPKRMAVLRGDGVDSADYLFIVNDDGTLLCHQSFSQEKVNAWSACITGSGMNIQDLELTKMVPHSGFFRDIIAIKDKVYVVVQRIVNGSHQHYIERLDFGIFTDSSTWNKFDNPQTVVLGLSHLEGEEVEVVGDGFTLNKQKVKNGQITLERAVSEVQAGLGFDVLLETIPVNWVGSHSLFVPKRVVRVFVDYYESYGIQVNGNLIPEMNFGNKVLGRLVSPKSGIYMGAIGAYSDGSNNIGWGKRERVRFTNEGPFPFLITGVGLEVSE